MGRALLDQPLALARRPAGILLHRTGPPHHAHHPRLAAPVVQQGAYHLLAIDTIGLGPPRAPDDGPTGRIDHQVDRQSTRLTSRHSCASRMPPPASKTKSSSQKNTT